MAAPSTFTTVRSEGGLLPPDLLARIVAGDADLGGLGPTDYGFRATERLSEAISRSWNRVKAYWQAFQADREALAERETGVSETRDWMLRLLRELGFERPEYRPAAEEIGGRRYVIQHHSGSVPLHIVSYRQGLDRAVPTTAGQTRMSPHALLQEYLNASPAALYGIVTNGLHLRLHLRLLRDNASMTRLAALEFDLETLLDNSVYADFVLLFLALHRTRLPRDGQDPTGCWLERWRDQAESQGTRALGALRYGVERAIEDLGRGLLAHHENEMLRDALRSGALSVAEFYGQLLRLVYRLIFLFVAEERDLLHPAGVDPGLRAIYRREYSASHLRDVARRHRTDDRHDDLWRTLHITFGLLAGTRQGLNLKALGGLFAADSCPHVDGSLMSNAALARAVIWLSTVRVGTRLRRVNYRDIGAEELGSVYESLLELHPAVDVTTGRFDLAAVGGHERKASGSYYTPTPITQRLLDLVVDPVLGRAVSSPDPEHALLGLKVCDPACGSGHFLIATAHRLARRLASIRAGGVEPSLEATRTALREVIGRCIYGVDRNPMAVELCKVSLWMEALEPGRPLSFLDQRIQCGNSLLGTTPALLDGGIPDDAFLVLEGDDKAVVTALRRQNHDERTGQLSLFSTLAADPAADQRQFTRAVSFLEGLPEETVDDVNAKEERYRQLASSPAFQRAKLLADAWCAAFVCEKRKGGPEPVTDQVFRDLASDRAGVPPATVATIRQLADQYRFFHWHLAFPEVFWQPEPGAGPDNAHTGWKGGFDVILGNPPWDTLSPDAKEFFSFYDPQVRFRDPEGQRQLIDSLLVEPAIAERWNRHRRELYAGVHFIKNSGRFRLFAPGNLGKGDFNIFRMFVETALDHVQHGGWAGQVAPEGLYNGANSMAIREEIFNHFSLAALLGFENTREVWFRGVDSRAKFCVYAARKGGQTETFRAAFNIRGVAQLGATVDGAALTVPVDLVREFSPDALALMEFADQSEIDIAAKMYARWPKFGEDPSSPLYRRYMREIDMGNDRDLFDEDARGVPVYEGRMVWHFDHRAKGYAAGRGRAAEWVEYPFGDPAKGITPQWFIPEAKVPGKVRERMNQYRIGFCDVVSPTNERTLAAALIPPGTLCGHKVPTILFEEGFEWAYLPWLAVANSFAMDFLVRKKVSLHMAYTVMDSLPFPRLDQADSRLRRIAELALRLSCTGPEMIDYWNAWAPMVGLGALPRGADPPGIDDAAQRLLARAELDALVARELFELDADEMAYILDTFPTARRYEVARYGTFKSRDLILDWMGTPSPSSLATAST